MSVHDLSAIPMHLRACRGWLLWKYEHYENEPKPRKVPYYVTGYRRSGVQGCAQDRARLATFETALAVLNGEKGKYDGIGLAMLPEWGLIALDFDGVEGEALREVERVVCCTYAEMSPSGRGVRAFMLGNLKDRKSHATAEQSGFEVFCGKGFVTVTGRQLDSSALVGGGELCAVTAAVESLYRARFGSLSQVGADAGESGGEGAARGEGGALVRADGGAGADMDRLRRLVRALDPDCGYDEWTRVGMALHYETAGAEEGLSVWDNWSALGGKYQGEAAVREKWDSFGRYTGEPVTAGWLEMKAGNLPAVVASDFENLEEVQKDKEQALKRPAYARNRTGEIVATIDNVCLALARPDVCGVALGFDRFRNEVMFVEGRAWASGQRTAWQPLLDTDMTRIQRRLERVEQFRPITLDHLRRAVAVVANDNAFDSAQLWLEGLAWDGVERVETFCSVYFGTEDSEYTRAVGRYLWTALAGRVMAPGCQADMVPILISDEGFKKSNTIAAMVPAPEFFAEVSLDLKEPEFARLISGVLVAEISEMRGLWTRDRESILGTITRKFEKWVPKYVEKAAMYPRRTIFIGTSNERTPLKKQGQNRRWLPMEVRGADASAIARDRNQLWAEALARWRLVGIEWQDAERLGPEGRRPFIDVHVWEPAVYEYLYTSEGLDGLTPARRGWVRVSDICSEALNMGADLQQKNAKQVAIILTGLGWEATRDTLEGEQLRCWVPK